MSAAVLNPPAACHAVVDRDGCHWMTHGKAVPVVPSSSYELSPTSFATVHSVRHPRRVKGLAHVVVEVAHDPFSLAMRLTPDAARALAVELLAGAERADQVQVALSGAKPC